MIYISFDPSNLIKTKKVTCKNSATTFHCGRRTKTFQVLQGNRKNDLILIMTPEKQDKTLELSKHWASDSTPARNEVIMKTTYPVNQ